MVQRAGAYRVTRAADCNRSGLLSRGKTVQVLRGQLSRDRPALRLIGGAAEAHRRASAAALIAARDQTSGPEFVNAATLLPPADTPGAPFFARQSASARLFVNTRQSALDLLIDEEISPALHGGSKGASEDRAAAAGGGPSGDTCRSAASMEEFRATRASISDRWHAPRITSTADQNTREASARCSGSRNTGSPPPVDPCSAASAQV